MLCIYPLHLNRCNLADSFQCALCTRFTHTLVCRIFCCSQSSDFIFSCYHHLKILGNLQDICIALYFFLYCCNYSSMSNAIFSFFIQGDYCIFNFNCKFPHLFLFLFLFFVTNCKETFHKNFKMFLHH